LKSTARSELRARYSNAAVFRDGLFIEHVFDGSVQSQNVKGPPARAAGLPDDIFLDQKLQFG
jgi:hypothetical protein